MTPNELYARTPEEVLKVFNGENMYYGSPHSLWGCYYNHVPEIPDEQHHDDWEVSDRVEMHVYKYFDFDGRRWWRLASVWFDNTPVMIIRNAGREGDDFQDRFITDPETYNKMIQHIQALRIVNSDRTDVVTPDADIENLTDFYGNNLDGHFERYRY